MHAPIAADPDSTKAIVAILDNAHSAHRRDWLWQDSRRVHLTAVRGHVDQDQGGRAGSSRPPTFAESIGLTATHSRSRRPHSWCSTTWARSTATGAPTSHSASTTYSRAPRRHAAVITTNLGIHELGKEYGERITSRLNVGLVVQLRGEPDLRRQR